MPQPLRDSFPPAGSRRVLSFLNQKGGTGKSTLAIATACALAARGEQVLLLDADSQGTSSDWGNRHARRLGVEVQSQVRPLDAAEVQRLPARRIVIDGPPGLSEMTHSIVACSGRVLIPARPALPDLWALPWLAALIAKLRREGHPVQARVLFTQRREEDVAAMAQQVRAELGLAVHPEAVPWDEAFPRLFEGVALPELLASLVLRAAGLDSGDEGA